MPFLVELLVLVAEKLVQLIFWALIAFMVMLFAVLFHLILSPLTSNETLDDEYPRQLRH